MKRIAETINSLARKWQKEGIKGIQVETGESRVYTREECESDEEYEWTQDYWCHEIVPWPEPTESEFTKFDQDAFLDEIEKQIQEALGRKVKFIWGSELEVMELSK